MWCLSAPITPGSSEVRGAERLQMNFYALVTPEKCSLDPTALGSDAILSYVSVSSVHAVEMTRDQNVVPVPCIKL
jgi:hypothetical protein